MPLINEIDSFWINYQETKFVTVSNNTLQLFYHPHILKCEMSRTLSEEKIGFKITMIDF